MKKLAIVLGILVGFAFLQVPTLSDAQNTDVKIYGNVVPEEYIGIGIIGYVVFYKGCGKFVDDKSCASVGSAYDNNEEIFFDFASDGWIRTEGKWLKDNKDGSHLWKSTKKQEINQNDLPFYVEGVNRIELDIEDGKIAVEALIIPHLREFDEKFEAASPRSQDHIETIARETLLLKNEEMQKYKKLADELLEKIKVWAADKIN